MIYILALTIGAVAGLRAVTAPAAVSWPAYRASGLDLSGSWLAFLGFRWTPWIISVAALGELVTDQLPTTPSRMVPVQFGARLVMGAVSGAAIGTPSGAWIAGLVLGVAGAVIGTLGGAWGRARLAAAFGRDRPAALIEDVVAIAAFVFVICRLS